MEDLLFIRRDIQESRFSIDHLLQLDVTELPDTDSLFEAEHAILQAEHHAAQVFGTARTLFSAGGCTLCIQAMLRLVSADSNKKTILTDRILHRSAVNAMALLDLNPVWLLPRADAGLGFPGRTHPDDVESLLKQYSDTAAVYITSPTTLVFCPISEAFQKYATVIMCRYW